MENTPTDVVDKYEVLINKMSHGFLENNYVENYLRNAIGIIVAPHSDSFSRCMSRGDLAVTIPEELVKEAYALQLKYGLPPWNRCLFLAILQNKNLNYHGMEADLNKFQTFFTNFKNSKFKTTTSSDELTQKVDSSMNHIDVKSEFTGTIEVILGVKADEITQERAVEMLETVSDKLKAKSELAAANTDFVKAQIAEYQKAVESLTAILNNKSKD